MAHFLTRRALPAALFLVTAVFGGPAPAQTGGPAPVFLSAINDLPLMAGLDEAGALQFDSPAGRIVDTTATGKVAPEQVRAFYGATLPQLGWARVGDTLYRREGELLRVEVAGAADSVHVAFSIRPEIKP